MTDSSKEAEPAARQQPTALAVPAAADPREAGPVSPGGRFIENISTEGSRTSQEVAEKPVNVPAISSGQETASSSRPSKSGHGGGFFRLPTKSKSTDQRPLNPLTNAAPKKVEESERGYESQDQQQNEDDDGEPHPWLAKLYPLSHFIGYRPRSHHHTPDDQRFSRYDPRFNRFHHAMGVAFSFGLSALGSTGNPEKYRQSSSGKINYRRMYAEQFGSKLVDAVHSTIAVWTLIVMLAFMSRSPFFRAHNAPVVIAAFGTEAVVTFVAFKTALAQPKNILFGNAVAAVIGVGLSKAFDSTSFEIEAVYGTSWAAYSTTLAVAVFAMIILGITHPPGGAIALLCATNSGVYNLNWWLVPIVIIDSLVVIGWALIINNLGGRSYPNNWFYPNAFAEPPIMGPDVQARSEAPYLFGRKRKAEAQDSEKGFYRVPDSGAKVTPNSTAATPRRTHSAKKRTMSKTAPWKDETKFPMRAAGPLFIGAPTSATPKEWAPKDEAQAEASKSEEKPATTGLGAEEPAITEAVTKEPYVPSAVPTSRLIEDLIRKNSKASSKGSRKSIQVHVNEPRKSFTKGRTSIQSASSVPTVQWR